jgi:hypothetical protein
LCVSALVGFGVLLVQMPFPVLFTRWLQAAAREVSKKSDDRVEAVTESQLAPSFLDRNQKLNGYRYSTSYECDSDDKDVWLGEKNVRPD